jgi:hypothetical protein
MCDSDDDDIMQEEAAAEQKASPAEPVSTVERDVGELVHDSETAVVSVLPAESGSDPTVTVVTPLREIMREQEQERELAAQAPPVFLWHGNVEYPNAVHYDPMTGQPFLIYPTAYGPVACFYAPCETWMVPPDDMGVPAEILERYSSYPKAVRKVFDTPELSALLCKHCRDFKNIEYGGEGNKVVEAFCGSCITILSRAPAYACACGKPRHLDPLAKPSGKVCSSCHQAARRSGDAKTKGRGKRT